MMKPASLLVSVPVPAEALVASWRSGMTANAAIAALAAAIEKVGPLERWAVEREWETWVRGMECAALSSGSAVKE